LSNLHQIPELHVKSLVMTNEVDDTACIPSIARSGLNVLGSARWIFTRWVLWWM